jgi:hypothetical protein
MNSDLNFFLFFFLFWRSWFKIVHLFCDELEVFSIFFILTQLIQNRASILRWTPTWNISGMTPPALRTVTKLYVSLATEVRIVNLSAIINFAPGVKLWPPGAKLSPRGEFCPLGWSYSLGMKFSVCPSILLNSRECSPLGVNVRVNIPPRVQILPLGVLKI